MDVPTKNRGNQRLEQSRPLWEIREVGTPARFFLSFKKAHLGLSGLANEIL
jgi:hypothetical protein